MNCRDTERQLNEWLDARPEAAAGVPDVVASHAVGCSACAVLVVRYRALAHAISLASARSKTPSPELTPAAVPLLAMYGVPRRTRKIQTAVWSAAAASMLVGATIGLRFITPPVAPAPSLPARTLADALADATSATLELAREASAPAGRVGRVLLTSAESVEESAVLPLRVAPIVPTTDVLRSVGDRVGAGVKPLAGSARHAFSFLLGAPSEDDSATPGS